jgi:hypothetical protein
MNRKRKINAILKKKQKKINAKLHHNNKPRYISKAERAAAELADTEQQPETNPVS